MIDIMVIGNGPAGLSAAINAVARNKTVCVLGKNIQSNRLYKAELINNYLGFPNVTGKELLEIFVGHAKALDIDMKEGRVLQILSMGDYYSIQFENDFFEAKTVIITTGISSGKRIAGEADYLGKGVSYCATCDGMLYRNKTVCVIGETTEGVEDANFLSEICEKVYYLPTHDKQALSHLNSNIEIVDGKALEVIGDDFVTGLKTSTALIPCTGVFFVKAVTPLSQVIYGLETENNLISVNTAMETNLAGVFSAGDCTGAPYQISKAVGEGLVAAQSAVKFLDRKK